MEIIPAIDIIDGKCVRLTRGDFNLRTDYSENPLEVAKAFEGAGIRRLHLVDLDGARQKKIINSKVLETIASQTSLKVDFGGGLQSDEDVELAFNSGAYQITGGSIAVRDEEMFSRWITKFGIDKIILGADAQNGKIAVSGWQEVTEIGVMDLIRKYCEKYGLRYIICTDVAKDGLLQGPSFQLYKDIMDEFPYVNLIASGGVTTKDDIKRLEEAGIYGAIVGKAFYEGKISLEDLAEFSS
ncbi:1-(5-phosphoribosyl)-5-[(5-phosphoribosylamino)methylideneamino]imidazole-4-carboxamide isomerase [Cytophagaceae bacterium ABcell3]|nr:1-(5-phosphoribosyl)-5-[(5-phosphoribosylamino)methylideneamino]imidazole-4-carboxamide isomerase [Cytophagaceae bacterium ABcell3]